MPEKNNINPLMAHEMQIYITGAFAHPIYHHGKWVWVIDEFADDSYKDGECVDPVEYSSKLSTIIKSQDE